MKELGVLATLSVLAPNTKGEEKAGLGASLDGMLAGMAGAGRRPASVLLPASWPLASGATAQGSAAAAAAVLPGLSAMPNVKGAGAATAVLVAAGLPKVNSGDLAAVSAPGPNFDGSVVAAPNWKALAGSSEAAPNLKALAGCGSSEEPKEKGCLAGSCKPEPNLKPVVAC